MKRLRFKNAIFVSILVFLFIEILIIFPQHLESFESDAVSKEKIKDPNEAEQRASGIHLVESQKGTNDWELFAKDAEGNQGNESWLLKTVKVNFYNKNEIHFVVTGESGKIDMKSKGMQITGHVKITSMNGYLFESDEVLYDANKRQILSRGPIAMQGPKDEQGEGLKVNGSQMIVEIDQSRMLVKEQIKASKKMKDDKKFNLSSVTAEFSGKNHEAKFLTDVVINYGETKIEGPAAAFIYEKKKSTLKNIIFSGGVRVSNEDKYAISDVMNLDIEANKFTFSGHPRVYQNNDELSGQQIVFLDGGKKVKVENIRATMDDSKKEKLKK